MDNKYAVKKSFITTMADDLKRIRQSSAKESGSADAKVSRAATLKEKLSGNAPKPPEPPLEVKEKEIAFAESSFDIKKETDLPQKVEGGIDESLEADTAPALKAERGKALGDLTREGIMESKSKEVKTEFGPPSGLFGRKMYLAIGAVLIAGIIGGVFYYLQIIKEPEIVESQEPTIVEAEAPVSILGVLQDELIAIDKDAISGSIYSDLQKLISKRYPQGSFSRILVKFSVIDDARNIEYRQFSDFSEFFKNNLNINVPADLAEAVENFTFFVYSQAEGNEIGIIAKIKGNIDVTKTLKEWEETSMINDFDPLLSLVGADIGLQDAAIFDDNEYRNRDIRYINFGSPLDSIDYSIVEPQDYLIITTSRDSMYAVIDNL